MSEELKDGAAAPGDDKGAVKKEGKGEGKGFSVTEDQWKAVNSSIDTLKEDNANLQRKNQGLKGQLDSRGKKEGAEDRTVDSLTKDLGERDTTITSLKKELTDQKIFGAIGDKLDFVDGAAKNFFFNQSEKLKDVLIDDSGKVNDYTISAVVEEATNNFASMLKGKVDIKNPADPKPPGDGAGGHESIKGKYENLKDFKSALRRGEMKMPSN